jgi:hypothetical protein
MHAMVVTEKTTYVDAMRPRPTPIGPEDTLAGVMRRLGRAVGMNGTVLLDKDVAGRLGLPTGELPEGEQAKSHPAVAELAGAGLKTREIHRWTRIAGEGGRELHVGLLEFIDPIRSPLVNPDRLADTAAALAEWNARTGVPYRGQAGDAGNALLRTLGRFKHEGKTREPSWWSGTGPEGDPVERAYGTRQWRNAQAGAFLHGYDRVRAYLAAMTVTEVAGFGLTRTRAAAFDPKRSGWWLVDVAPWQVPHAPDPAGYGHEEGPRWLTTPTLKLLQQLTDQGVHGGFTVLDSWTAKTEANVLKPYGTRLRQLWEESTEIRERTDRDALQATIKAAYRQAAGMWRSGQSDVQRPDWSAALVATARANLFRKIWQVGTATGRWPVMIDTDNVFYASDDADAVAARPDGIELVDKLGGFRIGKTIKVGESK